MTSGHLRNYTTLTDATDRRALALWNCLTNSLRMGGQRVEANGVMLLTFAADGRCRTLREWQHGRPAGLPLEVRKFPD